MPELYGNKYKWELRQEISEQRTEIWDLTKKLRAEREELRRTRNSLKFANLQIEALEAKIQRMADTGRALLAEAAQDVEADVEQKYHQSFDIERAEEEKRRSEWTKQFFAVAATDVA
jgi:hypothetical protein